MSGASASKASKAIADDENGSPSDFASRSPFSSDLEDDEDRNARMKTSRSYQSRRLALVLCAFLILSGCASVSKNAQPWLDFTTLERAYTPNNALVCSPAICLKSKSSQQMIAFEVDAATVGKALRRIEPSAEIRTEANGDIRARYVAVTSMLRFKDDVDVLIRPSGLQQSTMAVYSRSRVGFSDLGTNARRIDELERRLRAALSDRAQ